MSSVLRRPRGVRPPGRHHHEATQPTKLTDVTRPDRRRCRTLCVAAAIVTAALLLAPEPTSAQRATAAFKVELERRARAILDSFPIPGLAVSVVIGDSVAHVAGFGDADRETGAAVSPETLFQIGSVTKPLTATLAGLLRDRGTIAYEDRVADYLWEPAVLPDTTITVDHLLTHTSGLPGDAPTLRRPHDDYPILAFTHFELYRSLEASELAFPPGSDWSYSNFGYGVLGHVMEQATGRPYETLLRKELLEPLGMKSSTGTLWPELRDRLATPYYYDEASGRLTPYSPWDEEALFPAGGLSSTVGDLGRFVAFLLWAADDEESRLDAETLRRQQSIRHRLSPSHGYGMGWFVENRKGLGRVVYHGGGVDGYSAWLEVAMDRGVGVVVLVNSGEGAPIVPLARWVLAELAGEGVTN